MSEVPPPPPYFTSATPGYSVVLDDEPKKSRELVVLLVIGCFAAVVLVGSVLLLTHRSGAVSPFVDSQAGRSIAAPSTSSTMPLPAGEIAVLANRSPISYVGEVFVVSGLAEGACFDVVRVDWQEHPIAEPRGCNAEHFYQLYAVGELPSSVTDVSEVSKYWLNFCATRFASFVGVANVYSRFQYSGHYPVEPAFPDQRVISCYLYFPGEFSWVGSAKGSGE